LGNAGASVRFLTKGWAATTFFGGTREDVARENPVAPYRRSTII
jgi:hypothetical protein